MDIGDGSAATSEIVFSSLLDWLACDHPSLDLSSYTLKDDLGIPILEGATSYPPTFGPLVA